MPEVIITAIVGPLILLVAGVFLKQNRQDHASVMTELSGFRESFDTYVSAHNHHHRLLEAVLLKETNATDGIAESLQRAADGEGPASAGAEGIWTVRAAVETRTTGVPGEGDGAPAVWTGPHRWVAYGPHPA